MNKSIAECVGLWLAEGDRKCNSEITFTNNCFELVSYFHSTIKKLFENKKYNPRIYVYSPNLPPIIKLENCAIRYYADKRANKSYFIYRIASVELNKLWKNKVDYTLKNEKNYSHILRGFFAGEGNIHEAVKHRSVRIAQKERIAFLEKILNHFDIPFSFNKRERAYTIFNRKNWDKLARLKIADLHPIKKEKFWRVYNTFCEYHYSPNFLKNKIYEILTVPLSTKQLALKYNRSPARIQDILMFFKKEGKIKNYRVNSYSYWLRQDVNQIIVSSVKKKYLDILSKKSSTTKEIASLLDVDSKSALRRLRELHKLGLVERETNKKWFLLTPQVEVVVL